MNYTVDSLIKNMTNKCTNCKGSGLESWTNGHGLITAVSKCLKCEGTGKITKSGTVKPTKKKIEELDILSYYRISKIKLTLTGIKEEGIDVLTRESGKALGDKLNEIIRVMNREL